MNGDFLQCSANYIPLSPISFLERAAVVHGDKPSVIYGGLKFSWKETHQRCLNLAAALVRLGISRHDVLEAKVIIVDYQCLQLVLQAFKELCQKKLKPPLLILIPESDQLSSNGIIGHELPPGSLNYNVLQGIKAEAEFEIRRPHNECDPISVNYTSGSTGNPKGVVYSHRAAYLNSLGAIFQTEMAKMPVFLWTVDMFRCNGWCFPWAVAALGGTNICLRKNLSAKLIFESIYLHKVTHMCGSPCILNILAHHASKSDQIRPLKSTVNILVAGALPPPQILKQVANLGFNVSHGYGMTEALGPAIVTPCKPELDSQHNLMMEGVDVKDPNTMESVPCDGKTVGEIMFKGNTMMLGYLKNSKAVNEPFKEGWYRSGDLAIRHPNGYIQMKDRARDMIMSGGEAISTLEVEAVLLTHPCVLEAAVVGRNDDCLGKTPCAFVKLKEGSGCDGNPSTSKEIMKFCGEKLPAHMVPKVVVFGDLPLNSTGKIQKFVLREKANKEVYADTTSLHE
ncbi:isovalerate--CoA ligase CCL2-like isoform X2 [Argentina anserina]|uniref:isovalerate--CoA ligase CCL2-like isoform X2 n=1 Tax=Argentina anserina TaxID=57926 RepID=UPI0021762B41|nr:isovalerate--CoA ligase CCL2-like isoform X2 [Potentilla anserina]